jgi:hypothetical protein
MRVTGVLSIGFLLVAGMSFAQAQQDQTQPVGTMMEFMYSMVHPASNEILLAVNRGGPQNDKEWADVQRSALQLAESGNLLMMRGRARDQGEWMKDAKALVDVGAAAYKAAKAKDGNALAGLTGQIDAACVSCHKQYRPNVHPKQS